MRYKKFTALSYSLNYIWGFAPKRSKSDFHAFWASNPEKHSELLSEIQKLQMAKDVLEPQQQEGSLINVEATSLVGPDSGLEPEPRQKSA